MEDIIPTIISEEPVIEEKKEAPEVPYEETPWTLVEFQEKFREFFNSFSTSKKPVLNIVLMYFALNLYLNLALQAAGEDNFRATVLFQVNSCFEELEKMGLIKKIEHQEPQHEPQQESQIESTSTPSILLP